jgi:streptogrisin D
MVCVKRRKVLGGLATVTAVLAVNAVVAPGPANAAASSLMVFTPSMTDTSPATRLAAEVGADSVGVYLDRDGHVNVAVTTEAAANVVRARGGIPRMATRNAAELNRATAALEATARVPGASWWVDPESDQVVVTTDDTVSGVQLAKVEAAVAKLGSAARLTKTPGTVGLTMSGGDTIVSRPDNYGLACSLGFNVQADGVGGPKYFLTAGHCTNKNPDWYTKNTHEHFAVTVTSAWPYHDYGLAEYLPDTSVVHNGDVNLYNGGAHQDITSAGDVVAGQYVARTGITSGFHDGHVKATNATTTISGSPDPITLTGLIQTNICVEPGDSGGPLFAGSTAYGITSSSNRKCGSTDQISYFEPVTRALTANHVHIY